MIIIVATFAQALCGNSQSVKIIGALVVWRFVVSLPPSYLPLTHLPQFFSIPRRVWVLVVTTLWVLSSPQNLPPQKFVVVWWLPSLLHKDGVTLVRTISPRTTFVNPNPFPSRCSRCIHYYRCLQEHHRWIPINSWPSWCRRYVASIDRSRMCTRSRCTLLPSYHPRNTSFHHGYWA